MYLYTCTCVLCCPHVNLLFSHAPAIIASLMDPIAFVNSALAELAIGTENEVRCMYRYGPVHCMCVPFIPFPCKPSIFLAYSGILLYMYFLVCSCSPLYTLTYTLVFPFMPFIPLYNYMYIYMYTLCSLVDCCVHLCTLVFPCRLLHSLVYSCGPLYTLAFTCILLWSLVYSCIPLYTLAVPCIFLRHDMCMWLSSGVRNLCDLWLFNTASTAQA